MHAGLAPAHEKNARPFIVAVGGTTRNGSSTEKALRVALSHLESLGAETVLLGAKDLLLPMYDPTAFDRTPAAKRLVELLRRADGVLIGSPAYHGSISGLVKNALDYVEDMRADARPYLDGRAVGCIVTAAGWHGTATTLMTLRSVVHALRGWPTPVGVTINTAEPSFDSHGQCLSSSTAAQLALLGRQVLDFAQKERLARSMMMAAQPEPAIALSF